MSDIHNDANQIHDDESNPSFDFLESARQASESGDSLLSMYLYLAAFQKSFFGSNAPNEAAILGLKQAWAIALSNKERSLAEYIFEIMEPFLTAEEVSECARQLQSLAFDKLEEFGLSRNDLEEMAEAITEDLMGEVGPAINLDSMFSGILPGNVSANLFPVTSKEAKETDPGNVEALPEPVSDSSNQDAEQVNQAMSGEGEQSFADEEGLDYDSIPGFETVVQVMRDFGIGMNDDARYQQLVGMLNARHGISSKPAPDTLLFRSSAREDAYRFVNATVGELELPSVQMHMEENFQGVPVLCVSANAVNFPKSKSFKDVFQGGGVLVLEDLDLWEPPEPMEPPEDGNPFFMMQMTRGAREAMNLITSAVDNPEVYVIATSSLDGKIDEFFLSMMGPISVVDIELPNEEERKSIWMDLAKRHPSLRSLNKRDLVKYSANLPRIDIYSAAREAVDEAYKLGLMSKKYRPVTRENIFDKLAAYQPLSSNEYQNLEDEVIKDFQDDLSHIDDLLDE